MLKRGDTIEIRPIRPLCKESSQTVWTANVIDDELYGYFPIEFHDRSCPPETDDLGNPLIWWLTTAPKTNKWVLRASLASAPESPLQQHNYAIGQVRIKDGAVVAPGKKAAEPDIKLSPAVSVREALSESDLRLQRKIIQDQMFGQIKPPLVRTVIGGRNNGLGIRDIPETDLRREWLQLPVGGYIAVQINITDVTDKLIATTTLHGKITAKHPQSTLLNGLGLVYEFEPDRAVGDEAEIAAYTPIVIGRRKIKYWLCVYSDLQDNKVIATSGLVNYDEIVRDAGTGGQRALVLAEYSISNISLSTEGGTAVPFEAPAPTEPVAPIDEPTELAALAPTEVAPQAEPLKEAQHVIFKPKTTAEPSTSSIAKTPRQRAKRTTTTTSAVPQRRVLQPKKRAPTLARGKLAERPRVTVTAPSIARIEEILAEKNLNLVH